MLESEFKKKFCARVKRAVKPITILQYKQDATTVNGFPDTIIILEGITIFIEFKKSKTAKFRPGQKEWIEKLNDNGHFAWVCYPENADDILEEIKRIA